MNRIFIFLIGLYKKFISPLLPGACRFTPTCSDYSMLAFQNYSFPKAMYLSIHRILRCNPLSQGYEDPLPLPTKKS
ncbi:membrane protein insertion efficiency factor YidD [Leptospira sp. GIMC2001]|uniref:membrane protein insertion efficiency factor YidD n=1 Tax=Leptospira sp. GIMC2001 TaxID=1513297 RepID=UPI002349B333|nr:membrane protein insertion efficiency factor YidD [Leptospira sp. GIMC2001]WCL49008.1 membrane protein insertion efficiency factor YidD [Leptospira sp. GIMC2001]